MIPSLQCYLLVSEQSTHLGDLGSFMKLKCVLVYILLVSSRAQNQISVKPKLK